MTEPREGDVFASGAEMLINSVNCVGVMGRGLAKQCKDAFPDTFKAYKKVCDRGGLEPGELFVHDRGLFVPEGEPRYVAHLATLRHWRDDTELAFVRSGIDALADAVDRRDVESVAIPPVGCGYGGLDWDDVRSLIESAFADHPNVEVWIYPPSRSK